MTATTHEEARTSHACPHCSIEKEVLRSSIRERVVNTLCTGLLLAVLVPTFFLVDHWLEDPW
jgi:hypothetical protein